jgi:OFA family oxalate/formate antiporter-like MFS transporter
MCGIGRGIGYVIPVAVLVAWFPERRGTMAGLSAAAFGASALLAAPVGASLIITLGVLPTFAVLGSMSLALVVGAASVLTLPPPATTDLTAGTSTAELPRQEYTLREALRTWQWYGLWLLLFVTGTVGLGLVSQIAPMAQELAGVDALAAAGLISIIAAGNIAGRFCCGSLSDTVGRRTVFFAIIGAQAACTYLLALTHDVWAFTLLATLVVLGHGGSLGTMPAFVTDYYGPRHVGAILGLMLTASGFASLLGPLVLAVLREHTGAYDDALLLLAGLTALGAVVPLLLRPPDTEAAPRDTGLRPVAIRR